MRNPRFMTIITDIYGSDHKNGTIFIQIVNAQIFCLPRDLPNSAYLITMIHVHVYVYLQNSNIIQEYLNNPHTLVAVAAFR